MGWCWMGGPDMSDTARHEASHASACVWFGGRPPEFVSRTTGHGWPGEEVGRCYAPIIDEIGCRDVVVALVGDSSEDAPDWPPAFDDARKEKREALATLIRVLHLTEEVYSELVTAARELLDDDDFCRLRDALARALHRVPRLEREDIEALACIYRPEQEEIPCST